MVFLAGAVFFLYISTLQASPEPQTTVHIQNYDGPIILHSSTCDNQHRSCDNQHRGCGNQYQKCDPDCTCVSRQSYQPYITATVPNVCYTTSQSACYPTTTSYGYGNQYCNVDDLKIYSVPDNTCNTHNNCNKCGIKNYQCQSVGYC